VGSAVPGLIVFCVEGLAVLAIGVDGTLHRFRGEVFIFHGFSLTQMRSQKLSLLGPERRVCALSSLIFPSDDAK
jgi:hypothetical protein